MMDICAATAAQQQTWRNIVTNEANELKLMQLNATADYDVWTNASRLGDESRSR